MDDVTERIFRAADEGDAESAFKAAMLYKDGSRDVRKDLGKYAQYVKRAADADPAVQDPRAYPKIALAALLTARAYKYGEEGLPRDAAAAKRYYLMAADGPHGPGSGHPLACRLVGNWYAKGTDGFERDSGQAWHYLRFAADAGDGPSMLAVGRGYLYGTYAPADQEKAEAYLAKYLFRERDEKEIRLFSEYGENEEEALILYTERILGNRPEPCLDLLKKLPENFGAPWIRDALIGYNTVQLGEYEAAIPYLHRGIRIGSAACAGCLGWIYLNGYGVTQDFAQAKYYWELGADGGDKNCASALKRFDELVEKAKKKPEKLGFFARRRAKRT